MTTPNHSGEVIVLNNEEVAELLTLPDCLEVLADAYVELGNGRAVNRPRTHTHLPTATAGEFYRFKSMEGGITASGVYALRITSDIMRFRGADGTNRQEKIPAAANGKYLGLVLLFSAESGDLLTVFPDGVIQGMRVGATSALGAKRLSREDTRRVGLIGSGAQARWLLRALALVRPVESVRVYSPNPDSRLRFAKEMAAELGREVRPVENAQAAVEGADLIATATSSLGPVLDGAWLRPGVHVASTTHREIDDATLLRADVLIVNCREGGGVDYTSGDTPSQGLVLQSKLHRQRPMDWSKVPELAELLAGKVAGRTAENQVTLFLNNIGLGIQFAAVGARLYRQARQHGTGRKLPLDWFVESVMP